MARKIKLVGYVQADGKGGQKIDFPNRHKLAPWIDSLAPGTKVKLEMAEDETEHVKSHKGYYFAVVVTECGKALRDVCGYPIDPNQKDLIHDWLKKEFLFNSITVTNRHGETMILPPSTTRLDDDGWKDYLTTIITFAAEMWRYEIPRKTSKYFFPLDEPKHLQND